MTNEIQSHAMLVSLSISTWTARRHDKRVTREVADNHHTDTRAGRYNKNLLPIDAKSYQAVITAAGTARTSHYEQTLPWSDEGARILPAQNYFAYVEKYRTLENAFNLTVQEFVREYPALRDSAELALNGLFNALDYPDTSDLARRFSMTMHVLPIPSGDDFRVSIHENEAQAIRAQIKCDVNASLDLAMNDLYVRLHTAVSRMVERLSTSDAVFRDSLIENARELVDVLPRLNLRNDPHLTVAINRIKRELCSFDAQTIREDDTLRADLAARASQIQSDLAGYMGNT